MRGIHRNPSIIRRILSDQSTVTAEDVLTGNKEKTIAVKIEYGRFAGSIDNLVRAICFHHFGIKMLDGIMIQPEFMLLTLEPEKASINELINGITKASDIFFANSKFYGENPEFLNIKSMKMNKAEG